MRFTAATFANMLKIPMRTSYRLTNILNFPFVLQGKQKKIFILPLTHPLVLSLTHYPNIKPIWNLADITNLWKGRKGTYSRFHVSRLLQKYNVPVYNQSSKGLVYIYDLKRCLENQ